MANTCTRFLAEIPVPSTRHLRELRKFIRDALHLSKWEQKTGAFTREVFEKPERDPVKVLRENSNLTKKEVAPLERFRRTPWLHVFKAWGDKQPTTHSLTFDLEGLDIRTGPSTGKVGKSIFLSGECDFTNFEVLCGLLHEFFKATDSDAVLEGTYSVDTYPLRLNGSSGGCIYASKGGWYVITARRALGGLKADLGLWGEPD